MEIFIIIVQHLLFIITACIYALYNWKRPLVLILGSVPATFGIIIRLSWAVYKHPESLHSVYNSVWFIVIYVLASNAMKAIHGLMRAKKEINIKTN